MNHSAIEKPALGEKNMVPDSGSIFFPIHHVESATSLNGTISPNENTDVQSYRELSLNNITQPRNSTSVEEDKAFILCSPGDVFGPLGEVCRSEAFLQPRMERWHGNPYLCDALPISSENSKSKTRRATAANFISASDIPSMEDSRFNTLDQPVSSNDESFISFSKVETRVAMISSNSAFEVRLQPNGISNQVNKKEKECRSRAVFLGGSNNKNSGLQQGGKLIPFEFYRLGINGDSIRNEERGNLSLSSSFSVYTTPKASPSEVNDKLFRSPPTLSRSMYRYDQLSPPVISTKMSC